MCYLLLALDSSTKELGSVLQSFCCWFFYVRQDILGKEFPFKGQDGYKYNKG